jgi:hypothetical protein
VPEPSQVHVYFSGEFSSETGPVFAASTSESLEVKMFAEADIPWKVRTMCAHPGDCMLLLCASNHSFSKERVCLLRTLVKGLVIVTTTSLAPSARPSLQELSFPTTKDVLHTHFSKTPVTDQTAHTVMRRPVKL